MASLPKRKIRETISLSGEFFAGNEAVIGAKARGLCHEDEGTIFGQYIIFYKVYNEQRKKYGQTRDAVLETIRTCRDRDMLKQYLEDREQEVADIMMTLFDDEEESLEAYANGHYA